MSKSSPDAAAPVPPSPPKTSRALRQQKSQSRRYGFACSNCRRRKTKCDGNFPSCRKCGVAKETCHYDNRPSLASFVALEHELRSYQERIEQLRAAKDDERDVLLAAPITVEKLVGGQARASSMSIDNRNSPDAESLEDEIVTVDDESKNDVLPKETTIGGNGEVYFYGQTSLYHIDPDEETRNGNSPIVPNAPQSLDASSRDIERNEMRKFVAGISEALLNDLLDTYWCWAHPSHYVLSKKIFLRDLNSFGPRVSPFLLSTVLAQAARWSTRADATAIGEFFAKRALQLLGNAIDQGSTISTIQGLLIFSARECACGHTSQGWLYSGMAFRMARDLGLHVAPKKLGPLSSHFSDEDLALRHQVFWCCYTWDKTMSLCLGRAPAVTPVIELPTVDTLLDGEDADDELWKPLPTQNHLSQNLARHQALTSTTFVAYCELCIIIHGVLDKLYSRPHSVKKDYMLTYLTKTLETLDTWSSKLPTGLLIQEHPRTIICPPLQILMLNLLANTAAILLCRPFRAGSSIARERCTKAARLTDMLFTLHVRRFGFRSITWQQVYTMFVACTINVKDFEENRPQSSKLVDMVLAQEASARLDFGLELLRQATSTPSAARTATVISRLLQYVSEEGKGSRQVTTKEEITSPTGVSGVSKKRHASIDTQSGIRPSSSDHVGATRPAAKVQRRSFTGSVYTQHAQRSFGQGPSPGGSQGSVFDGSTPEMRQSDITSDTIPFTDDENGIETPFRWLPDNVYDDGSWMLTDIDSESWSLFNMPI